ncbi:MAG: hypothetical protein ABUK01_11695 [Leptospirales bacterium]
MNDRKNIDRLRIPLIFRILMINMVFFLFVGLSLEQQIEANEKINVVRYRTIRHTGNIEPWSMRIDSKGDEVKVTIDGRTKTGEMTKTNVILIQKQIQKIEIYENDILIRSIQYDYEKLRVLVMQNNQGKIKEKSYDLKDNILENEALIYLFGIMNLNPGEKYVFNHLNSKDLRVAEMYLKNKGEESMEINGKKYQAVKYEMGLNGYILSKFWPHKYYWWYDKKTGKFLQYEGMSADGKNIDRNEIVE